LALGAKAAIAERRRAGMGIVGGDAPARDRTVDPKTIGPSTGVDRADELRLQDAAC